MTDQRADADTLYRILQDHHLDADQARHFIRLAEQVVFATVLLEQITDAGLGPDTVHQLLASWSQITSDINQTGATWPDGRDPVP